MKKEPQFTHEGHVPLAAGRSLLYPRSLIFAVLLCLLAPGKAAAAVRYVDASSTNATPPYTNLATAARVIQDAVDAALPGDEIVVTNGIYATGGRTVGTRLLTNRATLRGADAFITRQSEPGKPRRVCSRQNPYCGPASGETPGNSVNCEQ